jgi:phage terminase small subunit
LGDRDKGGASNSEQLPKTFLGVKVGCYTMAGKATTKLAIKNATVKDMQTLGTYKPEYDAIIDIYCELREQYEFYTKQFKEKKFKCDEYTAAGGTKKSALVSTIETLRKDILQYSDRLYLNPKSMLEEKNKPVKKKSALAEALSKLEK